MRRWTIPLALLLGSAVVAVFIGELALRSVTTSVGPQDYLRVGARSSWIRLSPYRISKKRVKKLARKTSRGRGFMRYDAKLGWTLREGASNKRYRATLHGLRTFEDGSRTETSSTSTVARIALFGDSFTFGSELPYRQTWGAQLEGLAKDAGRGTEVLNFGVSGYGTDQAYLRYRELGRTFGAKTVVLGFQPENALRNLNIIRILYHPETGLPFSKPRFYLSQGELRLVNSPAATPRDLLAILDDPSGWSPMALEAFYAESRYSRRWWQRSRVLNLVHAATVPPPVERISQRERDDLCMAIIGAFAEAVEKDGGRFRVLLLSPRARLKALIEGRKPPFRALIARVDERYRLIDPTQTLLRSSAGDVSTLFVETHPNAKASKIIAEAVFRALDSSSEK